MKSYIPTRRRRNKILISFSGLFVCFLLTLALISVTSLVQASFIESPVEVASKHVTTVQEKISDSVASAQAVNSDVGRVTPIPVLTNTAVRVVSFPLEKAWPVRGRLTTYFSNYHQGIDIAISRGTPIHPFASGVVVRASWWGNFGNTVIVQHSDGWQSLYAHMNSIAVTLNQEVNLSSVLGVVGSTGYSTGPHLHLQLSKDGNSVNPLSHLP